MSWWTSSKPFKTQKYPDGETETVTEAAPGEGPIDAAFNAVNRIAGVDDAQLVSYNITAITEGTPRALADEGVLQQFFCADGMNFDSEALRFTF